MKALVTGGAGFIGSNLAKMLVEQGLDVTVLDNLSLGVEENLSSIRDKIKFVKGDICNRELVFHLTEGMDFVFNQAAASSSPMFHDDFRRSVAVNTDGFVNVLDAAKAANVKRVIYASSSSIYGDNAPPHREDMKVVPTNFYSATKLHNEHLAKIYTKQFGLQTVGFRYFSVYGPNERAKGKFANTVSQFMWDMKEGKRPLIYGDGSQTRDFTFVKDICRANILATDMSKNIGGEVFNLGTGIAKSFNDTIVMLNAALGTNIDAERIANPISNYVAHTLADTTKAEQLLGFKAEYSLEDGLKEIV
jgi:UDP-glucose 4-epimerase